MCTFMVKMVSKIWQGGHFRPGLGGRKWTQFWGQKFLCFFARSPLPTAYCT